MPEPAPEPAFDVEPEPMPELPLAPVEPSPVAASLFLPHVPAVAFTEVEPPAPDEPPAASREVPEPTEAAFESVTPAPGFIQDHIEAPGPVDSADVDDSAVTPALRELAGEYGVATEFWDWQGTHRPVSRRALVAVLAAMEVDAGTDDAVEASLASARERAWRRTLPPIVVVRGGKTAELTVHVPHGESVEVSVSLEDGSRIRLTQVDRWVEPKLVEGRLVGQATFTLPADLPLGWHRVHARHAEESAQMPLVVAPDRLELPPALRENRAWGYMTQLYSVRSRSSWGLGDLADLSELATWSAREQGAGFVLVNPLHAAEPIGPMTPSPYLPTTRRFVNPIYLRVEDIREVGYLPATDRAILEWHAEAMRAMNTLDAELDRDSVWAAKRSALETVFAYPRSPAREVAFRAFIEREGEGLRDFATWCALAERYGLPAHRWPDHARDPRSEAVAQLREELADRVEFHMWLQWCLDDQLATAQRQAREAGMSIGIVQDLAVGVHPDGAEPWALQGLLAHRVSVGAPPDAFNQQGQDWSQPPWRPDRLAESGYAPFRDMIRTILRHAGGVRVDHILGLFRLWWIPNGMGPESGTYVRYDHEAMVGILALEAHRAGAFVVGEDLGTVEPWVRDYLRDRGVLGTAVAWWERGDGGRPLAPQQWRELCLATVTTHDLPPTAGYLAGEHIEVRARLGLLARSVEDETRIDEADREQVLAQLRELGLLGAQASEREKVEALHRFLTRTPAKLLGVALPDAVGDRRAMNQPGTNDEYPNWRLPLADGLSRPVLLEDVMTSARAASLAQVMRG
jgi:4-alpha-glucanotransferase